VKHVYDRLLEQSAHLDNLIGKVHSATSARRASAHDGDRVYAPLIQHITFDQGAQGAQDIVFQIPENLKFYVERVNFYVGFRMVTIDETVDGPSENVFRPCVFTHYEEANNPLVQFDAASVDALVAFSETYFNGQQVVSRVLQNTPTPVSHFYSGALSMRQTSSNGTFATSAFDLYYANSSFPSGLLFAKPWYLPGGASVTLKVSPVFAGLRVDPASSEEANVTARNEYRFTAVLDGYKKVMS